MTLSVKTVRAISPDDNRALLLDDIGFELLPGTVTLLIGRTGSGKSTLLQLLAGIREPDAGDVCLDGVPIWVKGRVDRSHLLRLGLTFQFPEQQLFARTIGQEFAYSLRPYKLSAAENAQRIETAAAEADPRGALAAERSPFMLSGGEQRRLAMATTYATEPDWLLMDEPTAGLESAAVAELLRYVEDRKRQPRGGVVIATHDLDAFFPIADRVILLRGGRVAADGPSALFCSRSELLVNAGVGVPGCVRLAEAFAARGLALDPALLTPERMAAAIAEAARGVRPQAAAWRAGGADGPGAAVESGRSPDDDPGRPAANQVGHGQPTADIPSAAIAIACNQADRSQPTAYSGGFRHSAAAGVQSADVPPAAADSIARRSEDRVLPAVPMPDKADDPGESAQRPRGALTIWHRLDPRAKWLAYFLFVVGTMLQNSWWGLIPALVLIGTAFAGLPASAIRGLGKIAKPFGLFMLISVLLAGLDVSLHGQSPAVGFSADRAAATGLNVSRLLLVTIASYWLSATTPFGRMVQGLNWALSFGRKLKLPLDSFALAVSLVFRFIPIIMREWQRFSAIVRARGKAALRPGTVRARDIPALVVPLLLSLFQRAEDMTTAMEMKRQAGQRLLPSGGVPLRWTGAESLAVIVSIGWLAVMAAIRAWL